MPYATSLTAIAGARLEPIVQPALKFHNQIAYDDAYFNGLATDVEEGDRLAGALKDKRVAMLANHGVIATGPSVAHAFNDLYYLERAAQAQVIALSTGQELQRIPQDVCARTFEQMQADRDDQSVRHLDEIKRILARKNRTTGIDYAVVPRRNSGDEIVGSSAGCRAVDRDRRPTT